MGGCSAASSVGVGGGREFEKITGDTHIGSVGKGDGDDQADLRISSSSSAVFGRHFPQPHIPAGSLILLVASVAVVLL